VSAPRKIVTAAVIAEDAMFVLRVNGITVGTFPTKEKASAHGYTAAKALQAAGHTVHAFEGAAGGAK
jgi:hypothetical protein